MTLNALCLILDDVFHKFHNISIILLGNKFCFPFLTILAIVCLCCLIRSPVISMLDLIDKLSLDNVKLTWKST